MAFDSGGFGKKSCTGVILANNLARHHPRGQCQVTCDWTHTMDHLGYKYGVLCGVLWRCIDQRWRKSCWPLIFVCHKEEVAVKYDSICKVIKSQCEALQMPFPRQVHLDWWGGAANHGSAAVFLRAFPTIRVARGVEHMRRALQRQSRKRPLKTSHDPEEGPPPPRLKNREIGVVLAILYTIMFMPTQTFLDVALQNLRARMEEFWDEKDFSDYFFTHYCLQDTAGRYNAPWFAGLGGKLAAGHGPSQQPAEQQNRKLKQDLQRSGENLATHSAVVSGLQKVIRLWIKMPLKGSKSKKPLTLMAERSNLCTAYPTSPCAWMLRNKKGMTLRRPGGRKFLYPTIPIILRRARIKNVGTVRRCSEKSDSGQVDRVILCMATGKPERVPKETCDAMIVQLKTHSTDILQGLLQHNGVFSRDHKFHLDRYRALWEKFCLQVWVRGQGRVRCSCWCFCWRGSCPHAWAAEEFLRTNRWSQQPLPKASEVRDISDGETSLTAHQKPKRRKSTRSNAPAPQPA